jgi:hypothetical protein
MPFVPNPPGPIDPKSVYGQEVKVHYNLHRCSRGVDPKEGESCWVVSTRQQGRWKVAGYVEGLLMKDVTFKVSRAGVDRIRRIKKRKVVAWFEGVAANPNTKSMKRAIGSDDWLGVGFNPFEGYDFYLYETDEAIDEAPLAYVSGRKAITLLEIPNPGYEAGHAEEELEVLIEVLGEDVSY